MNAVFHLIYFTMSIETLCRLCLVKPENPISIFGKSDCELEIGLILAQHFWFNATETDEYSSIICLGCWERVEAFHKFYIDVETAYKNLKSSIEKEETNDNELNSMLYVESEINIPNERTDFEVEDDKPKRRTSNRKSNRVRKSARLKAPRKSLELNLNEISKQKENIDSDSEENSDHSNKSESPPKESDQRNSNKRLEEDNLIRSYMKMECEMCSEKFKVFRNASRHYQVAHKTKGYLRCCNEKFNQRFKCLRHIERHINPGGHQCEQCGKTLVSEAGLLTHMEVNHSNVERKFECHHCPKKFLKKYQLVDHLNRHAPKEENKFFCEECGKSFRTKPFLQLHKRSVHEGAYSQVCDVCAKVFKSRISMEQHRLIAHSEVPLPKVQCDICGIWLKHVHILRNHMKLHEEASETHTCSICGKKAPNKKALRGHFKRNHEDERVHKCNVCNKAFKRPISLTEHMAAHTGDTLYNCPHCPKTFNSNANMYNHIKKMHTEEWEENRRNKGYPKVK